MSKQISDNKPALDSVTNNAQLQKQIHQVKKKVATALVRLMLSLLVVIGVFFLFKKNPSISYGSQYAIIAISLLLIIFIFLFGKFSQFLRYLKDSIAEFRKIVWPEKSYTIRMTGFVIIFTVIITIFIYGVDSIISWALFDLLMK